MCAIFCTLTERLFSFLGPESIAFELARKVKTRLKLLDFKGDWTEAYPAPEAGHLVQRGVISATSRLGAVVSTVL